MTFNKNDSRSTDIFPDEVTQHLSDTSLQMEIVIGESGMSSILDFELLDKDGKAFGERPNVAMGAGPEKSSILFWTESNSDLANQTKFIVIKGFDAEKNNGITSVIFEFVK